MTKLYLQRKHYLTAQSTGFEFSLTVLLGSALQPVKHVLCVETGNQILYPPLSACPSSHELYIYVLEDNR